MSVNQFDTAFYLSNNTDVRDAIFSGAFNPVEGGNVAAQALAHFNQFGANEGRNPNAEFDIAFYAANNSDVADAVANGAFPTVFDHFQQFGLSEDRVSAARFEGFDADGYLAANPDVASAVDLGLFDSALDHFLAFGIDEARDGSGLDLDALDPPEPVVDITPDLIEALETLQAAETARSEFLESALENEAVAEAFAGDPDDPAPADIVTAIETIAGTDVTDGTMELALETELGLTNPDFTDAGTATKAGLVADGRTAAQADIDAVQSELNDYNAEIAKVDGLEAAIAAKSTATANLEDANAAQADAEADFAGADVTFEARNTTALTDLAANAAIELQQSDGAGGYNVWTAGTDPLADLAQVADTANGGAVLYTVDADQNLVAGADLGNYVSTDPLQTSIQGLIDAVAEQEAAVAADGEADTALEAITDLSAGNFDDADFPNTDLSGGVAAPTDGADVFTNLAIFEGNLDTAQMDQQDLEDDIAAWEAAVALDADLADANAAVTAAEEAIEGDDGLDVTLVADTGTFDGGDGVFVFADSDATLNNFGDDGEDRLFFGDGFELVELAEGEALVGQNIGDVNALEIFWQQEDNGDLTLFAENETFAGNSQGDNDVSTITLTGFAAADITGFADGFLTAGTVEVA